LSILALLAVVAAATAGSTGSISVDVSNVRNDRGMVVVDICPKDKFLDDGCPYRGAAKAHAGTTTVVINNVPAGEYAAQAFHDENDNDKVDRALFGIPKEGVGFSRDARIRFSPPKWKDAVFDHQAKPETIKFKMRYFLGKKGPPKSRK
jgi:uncharacterized protein (DUF2141 family)